MLKKSILFLSLVILTASLGIAQYQDLVKTRLNEALKAHLVNVSPPPGCACNACKFNYSDAMKIDRTKTVEGVLRVWGVAKVKYASRFDGAGTKNVKFYAELKKSNGTVTVTKLRWQSDTCMRMTDIM
ncbi:MAG: hypothetical protein AB8F95_13045 [Bacteroidia bacterium]